jgi:host factor-I protein
LSKTKTDPHALQSEFLARNLGKQLIVFLINGVRLSGKLRQFDQYCLLIESDSQQQLIFKSAVSAIMAAAR